MGLLHRKILEKICYFNCKIKDSSPCSLSDCKRCSIRCYTVEPPSYYGPPTPPLAFDEYGDFNDPSKIHHNISTWLTVVIAILSAAFFALLCFAVYRRFLLGCLRRRNSEESPDDSRGDFLDEEEGPVVDHPIWYIRTPGLQQSIISAITVCKYKKGEGLIDGTECSVCLSEFEEDENLRLLPKCNHAFHLPCIDAWLRSHTNCPMCRAPIVTNPTTVIASPEPNAVDSTDSEEPQMETVENGSGNNSRVVENSDNELRDRDEEEGDEVRRREMVGEEELGNLQPRRRSVSLDSSAVEKINRALARTNHNTVVGSSSSSSSSKRVSKSGSSSFRVKSLQIVAGTSMKRSRSYNGKNVHNSRSQRKSSVPIRSF